MPDALLDSLAGQADFICQPCDRLAAAIERQDTTKVIALCARFTKASGQFDINNGQIDTLVLGCTHYPFASQHLAALVGADIHLIDSAASGLTAALLKAARQDAPWPVAADVLALITPEKSRGKVTPRNPP